ncbi:transglycosylase domain-containing protein [Candidatus Microgenomates bacterium]|nr:transglycosylase domain-containing protein [Candidatus Microgenomates bacterium]
MKKKKKTISQVLGKISKIFARKRKKEHLTPKPKQKIQKKAYLFWLLPAFLIFLFFYFYILKDLPSPQKLARYESVPQSTQILDRHGKLLYNIFTEEDRTIVKLEEIPLHLRQATVAIEDKNFYQHTGINPIGGMMRALKEIVFHQKLQGGSTITQQLVKSALLTPERTIRRKFKEIFLAFWAEIIYSKNQILEMYLNQVPYGGTAWGISSAASKYFDKEVKDLTLAESSLLAGLPAAPTRFSPFGAHPELANSRQHEVLRRMVEDSYISEDEKKESQNQELKFAISKENIRAPYFVMYVKDRLVEKYGQEIVERGGLKVTTTLDLELQEFAENTVATEAAKLEKYDVSNGTVLVTRPPTGEILTMVGGADYFATPSGNVNVTLAHRQPGSSIKPINYALGLESKRVTPASLFLDTPTCFSVVGQPLYCPRNYDGQFHGPVQMRFALGNSYNIPAVKMLSLNSVEEMIATASAMGITTFKDPANYGLSLTLGGGEVKMVDMAVAFGVFANSGIRKDLVSILKIEDTQGKILEEFENPNFQEDLENLSAPSSLLINGPRVLSQETCFLISHVLLDNNARAAAFGTLSNLVVPDKAVSVKTGTTDDLRDNWTIGFTPNFLVATWVGNNDNTPMNPYLTSGITGAAPIWNEVMTKVLENQSDLWPKKPEAVVGAQICSLSGRAVPNPESDDRGCSPRFEYFIKGTVPQTPEILTEHVPIDKTTGNLANQDTPPENAEGQDHQVATDVLGNKYCLDCPHDNEKPLIIR